MHESSKPAQVAKLTFIGTGFVAIGAVLSVYFPPFKKPVAEIQRGIAAGNKALSETPIIGPVFKDNPLTNNHDITTFLAVNAFETVLAGGLTIAGGALMKLCGVLPHHLEEKMKRHQHSQSPRSPTG